MNSGSSNESEPLLDSITDEILEEQEQKCCRKTFEDAVNFIGMMVGSYFWGSIGDLSGRKVVMILSLFVNGFFGLVSSFAPGFWLFFVFRFCSGVGVGGNIPVIWSYFSEFQPSAVRGRMLSFLATFWMVGQLLTAGLAWILIPKTELAFKLLGLDFQPWRLFIALSTLTCLTSSFLVCILPESPKFLLQIDRLECEDKSKSRNKARETSVIARLSEQTAKLFHPSLIGTTYCILTVNFCIAFGITHYSFVGLATCKVLAAVLSAISAFFVWFVSSQSQVLIFSCVFAGVSVVCWNCLDAFGTELFPTESRSTALGLCLLAVRLGGILGNLTFGFLIDAHCAIPLLLVTLMIGLAALVSLKLKETSGTHLT